MFGINVLNLIFRTKINSVKPSIHNNSVGSCHMFHCWTSTFDNHLNHGFIVLKHIQQNIGTRMCPIWWNVINVDQMKSCRQVPPWPSYIIRCWLGLYCEKVMKSIYISHECMYSATVLKVHTHQQISENCLYISQPSLSLAHNKLMTPSINRIDCHTENNKKKKDLHSVGSTVHQRWTND